MASFFNISMHYGPKVLFEDVTLNFHRGKRYGMVGANGAGKSTVLKILSGQEQPSAGEISIAKEARVGFLKQDHFAYESVRVLDVVLQGNQILWNAMHEKEQLLAIGAEDEISGHRLGELETVIADEEGYEAESQASEILSGLGIRTHFQDGPLSALSGGFKLRVLLAQVLFQRPDLLLLDEPTNHLDIVSIQWLEEFLVNQYKGTLLVVSHDRDFMNQVCTHIADVDYETITVYTGNYDKFLEAKDLAQGQQVKAAESQEKKIADMQAFVDRFKAKASKARQAQSRVKQIEKMDRTEIKRSSRVEPIIQFTIKRPSGKEVLVVKDLSKTFGNLSVLSNIQLEIYRGQKVAIVGPNGVGKSTLLKILMGQIDPSSGSYQWGHEAAIGYFAQDAKEEFKQKINVYEWLYQFYPEETIGAIRGTLGKVLFSGDDVQKSVQSLSGGEQARLLFARLILRKDNILILDEPTNHLDLEGMDALEKALKAYQGTLLVVSHDRRFVANVADHIIAITPAGIDRFEGSYHDYLQSGHDYLNRELQQSRGIEPSQTIAPSQTKAPTPQAPTASHQDKKELQKKANQITKQIKEIEQTIKAQEKSISDLDLLLGDPEFYKKNSKEKVQQKQTEKSTLEKSLKQDLAKWEQFSEDLESLS